ncbi:MAG TPA: YhjD/YihY/BrkB family envelope integrity protein [Verrucomicrobiae bacterium]|nr:YhjD/YihY/BrkB family envelope integrity protein [Verrucomicrobiae bacterium]
MKSVWALLKDTIKKFSADPILRLSAATAYYSIFSIAPLLVLIAGLAALVFGEQKVSEEVGRQLTSFVGPQATHMIQSMMTAQKKSGGLLAVIIGGIALVFGATAVFTQLQESLNIIWGVRAKPGHGTWLFVRDRVLSLAMVLGIGFLLLVSMALSTAVNAFTHFVGQAISLPDWMAPFFEGLASFVVISVLFTLIFKILPDVKIRWRDVWVGAIGTAALFSGGKYLLGLYLSHETDVSAYGAGSAFVVILLYVYYASVILYFGAEFTQVYAQHQGVKIEPSQYAVNDRDRRRKHLTQSFRHGAAKHSEKESAKAHKPKKHRGFWRRRARDLWIAIPTIGILLVGIRLALPYLALDYVNHTLKQVEGFDAGVKNVRINLYRGAYTIQGIQFVKTNADVTAPFLKIPEMDISVEWKELFHGAFVGKIVVNRPEINFENGPTEQEKQVGMHKNWKQTLEKLLPFTINRFQVNDGAIRFSDPHRNPPVALAVTNLFATATNLTNVRDEKVALPAGLIAYANTTGNGALKLQLHMNPFADTPTFKMTASLTNVDLTALNDFMKSYGHFDVQHGTFATFLDIAAAHEHYQGYVKPFFYNLQIFSWQEAKHENILHDFWEAIVAGVSHVLRNQPYDQLATTIPISGTFESGGNVDLWTTIGGILQNAFIRALLPKLNQPAVPLPPPQGPDTSQSTGAHPTSSKNDSKEKK